MKVYVFRSSVELLHPKLHIYFMRISQKFRISQKDRADVQEFWRPLF